ncbi:hypothetical protein EL18_00617 [Nitratireductor basaltis]|uniref:Uncharacterized protein n=1 Tax=Nitratireductor basaltis TaxID=472175 RepID=A0A084U9G5_9HYPH|nr:hypothetical protein EL18_00617 [Nitratireductor basaltis]
MRDTHARNKSRRIDNKEATAARTATASLPFSPRTSFAGVTLSPFSESASERSESLIHDLESEDLNLFRSEMPCLHVEMHSSAGRIAFPYPESLVRIPESASTDPESRHLKLFRVVGTELCVGCISSRIIEHCRTFSSTRASGSPSSVPCSIRASATSVTPLTFCRTSESASAACRCSMSSTARFPSQAIPLLWSWSFRFS